MKVILVDDELLARDRLRELLAGEPDGEIVAEAGDGHAALHACAAHDPDLVLLATGYRPALGCLATTGALDADGAPVPPHPPWV